MWYILLFFVIGTIFGSFYYVVGTRLAEGKSILYPGSHCTFCHHKLHPLDLIPIFSYLFLGGKCRYCHHKISIEYLLYELLTGLLFAVSYAKFGFSYQLWIMLILSSLLVIIFITDFKYCIILDSPLIISLVAIFVLKGVYYGWHEALLSLGHGCISFVIILVIRYLGNLLFKRESLGGGDVKFSFIMGMVLNFKYAFLAFILSTFLALPYALATIALKKDTEVPFGPFLVSSLVLVFFFYEKFANLGTLIYGF